MRGRLPGPIPERTLAVRGLIATVVAVVVAVLLVARGAGALDTGAMVTTSLPGQAGRVPVHAPVYHLGVKVGDVRGSEGGVPGVSGESETDLEILVASDHADRIPADVVVRAVPRTLFGDIRLDLVQPDPSTGVGTRAGVDSHLRDGDRLPADRSEEAVLLYDVFTRASDLLVSIRPDRLQVTLTALDRALSGRGELLGRVIEDADRAGEDLDPALQGLAGDSAAIAYLAEDLADAAPELVDTVREATRLSRIVLDRPGSLSALLDAGLAVTGAGAAFADRTVSGSITLVRDTGVVLDRTARNPHGVVRTLYALRPMGEAGSAAFSTGRFAITAVPSFADPMPYGPQDCPRYPDLAGSTCGGAPDADRDPGLTVNAAAERDVLRALQDAAASEPGSPVPEPGAGETVAGPGPGPDAAAWTMLGPLVRGTEVTVR
ncbi:MCE family protein [Dietzia sp. PP-33]|jgi:phospholipid/cholesterol/gamma-HCH transport system substrate-binding protein|uniref:MCE family protein n=1 Tax=Dietzia sp. PP-33 TaxID=2957500 RepID=UPI0029B986ED|nr:MCE family protein [Dietzia sp. PP-33]MDX2357487.1 MCE family protein [Dietzia sp. PP-33]